MVESRGVEDLHAGSYSAAFGLVGAVNQAGDARLHERSGAHGARLDGYVKRSADEAMIAGLMGSLAQSHHFRMSGRVAVGDGAIARSGENPVVHDDQGSNRDFSAQRGSFRLHDREVHVFEVVHGC